MGLRHCSIVRRCGIGLLALIGIACVSDRPATAPSPVVGDAVEIRDFAFTPASLSAPSGTLVTWTNHDDVLHAISADDGTTFDSGTFGAGETFQFTTGAPGTYTYTCQLHPFMKATLVVTP